MSQGQWRCTREGATAPTIDTITKEEEEGTSTSITTSEAEVVSWKEDTEKALGNIHLCLHHTIEYQFNDEDDSAVLWVTLKKKYGAPEITRAFVEFKGIMDTVIPKNTNPSPALEKIMAHHTHLINMKWEIPDKVLGMMLLSKAPSSMETTVQMITQLLSSDYKLNNLEPERIIVGMRQS